MGATRQWVAADAEGSGRTVRVPTLEGPNMITLPSGFVLLAPSNDEQECDASDCG